jgi:hypothetical protein
MSCAQLASTSILSRAAIAALLLRGTARRQLADLVETMGAGVLPAAQSRVIRVLADLMAVELEQAARVIVLRGEAWARAIEPDRSPDASGMPAF